MDASKSNSSKYLCKACRLTTSPLHPAQAPLQRMMFYMNVLFTTWISAVPFMNSYTNLG